MEKVPHPEYPITDPVAYTNNLMLYSYAYPQLVLKYDSYCNSMFDPYRSPQFTAVRTNFGTSSSLYYGGYFAPTHVVAADMGKYAAAILKGKPVTKLPPAVHQADYWIDYNALMRIAPINEEITLGSLQKRGYHFVNLPFKVLHPVRYYVIPGLIILVIVFVVGYITYCIERRRRDELNRLKKKLEDEIEVGNMVLQNLNGTIFTYRDGCLTIDENFMRFVGLRTNIIPGFEIRKLVHPNYLDDFDVLLDSFWHPGIYQNQLCVRFDEHADFHWFLLQYVVKTPGEADGFSMMDDKNVLREQKIKNAEKQMQTAMEKNDFLNNISYLVRGPLSSILGFSEIMTTDYSELTPEERKEFSGIISDTSRQLLATVNQVLE
ncbi:MAG: hypothetical protein HUJ93_09135, partial [Bacteroidales bacterium]|nr:hypothetical protein [Bacteroidales bacterium]